MTALADARDWLDAFCAGGGDAAALFADGALWRDYLACHWDLRTHEGLANLQAAMPTVPWWLSHDIK